MTADILDRFLESATTTEIGIAAALLLAIICGYAYSVATVIRWLEWMYRVRRAERLQGEGLRVVGYGPERRGE